MILWMSPVPKNQSKIKKASESDADLKQHNLLILLMPEVGVEPTRPQGPRDFESRTSTRSITPAYRFGRSREKAFSPFLSQDRS